MATYTEVWKCCECREVHDDEDAARECCQPQILELFRCDLCSTIHEDEADAETCCGVSASSVTCPTCYRAYRSRHIGASAIEAVGHCQACNPQFSVDEQFKIEDLHYDRTGTNASILQGG